MLFLVGLELESQKVWELRKTLFGLGGLQVLCTLVLVAVVGHLLNFSWAVSVVIGMGVAMSSTAIGLTALTEKKLLSTPGGQASICHAAVSRLIRDSTVHVACIDCPQWRCGRL